MTTSQVLVSAERTEQSHYSLLLTNDADDVRAAQRLRHQVFADEMGATLHGPDAGIDSDHFDEFCDHIVVRDEVSGMIVGTYRMLPPDRAVAAGGLYCETEFEVSAIARLRPSLVETGRSCVHPEHRSGAVVSLMWAGIARYLLLTGHRWLAGCASVPLADGGALAASTWRQVSARNLAPQQYRVRPLRPWCTDAAPLAGRAPLPPLLRGYLRLGAWVCGPPAHDSDFGVADMFVLLGLDHLDTRYVRFFLGDTA